MKKMLALVALLVAAICALTIINFAYDVTPDVVIAGGETANAIATSSADLYTADRQENPVGINAENQYDIIADNDLYGQCDYGDYVPAEVRYVDGFPTVDGEKVYSKYYEDKDYVKPAEEEKDRDDWNLHDFHKNGEMLDTMGKGDMYFATVEDLQDYAKMMKEEYGDYISEYFFDKDGNVVGADSDQIYKGGATLG